MIRSIATALVAAGLCFTNAYAAEFSALANPPTQSIGQVPSGGCGSVILTQNANNTPAAGNSVSCNAGGLHADNSYFRAFASATIPTGFSACAVEFGIESANASGTGTTQPVTVNIYSSTGAAFPGGTRVVVGTATVQVADQALTLLSVPLTATVPAGAELVAEVFTPDGQAAGHSFFIGSNTSAETGPSYIQAAACGINTPTDLAAVGFANMNLVLNVLGDPAGPAATDLQITKTDGVTTASPGGTLTYTIVATNAGPAASTGAVVADTFPASLTCSYTSAPAGGATGNTSGSGNINDTLTLPASSSVTYTATCTVSGGATGTIANTATITAPQGQTDSDPSNNSATDTDTVTQGATVGGTKTASQGTVSPGGSFSYTVVLTNSGQGTQGDNPGDEFTDVLPAGVTGTSVSATSGTATLVGNTVTWNGSIAPSGSVTITINATLSGGATSGSTIDNQGTINFDSNGDGTNDATAQTDNPALPGAADPTGIVVGAPLSVPVNSTWMLVLLGLGLALFGLRRTIAAR